MTYGPDDWNADEDFDGWYTHETGRLIEGRLDAETVLEIGCSTGVMTPYLVCPGRRVLAVTLNEAAAEVARARVLDGVRVVCGDVMDFRNMEFDAIVCCLVLHEVVSPASMMRKCHELLAPGGRVFVTVPSANSLHFGGAPELGDRSGRFGVKRLWTPRQWRDELTDGTGLRVVESFEFMLKPWENARMACLAPAVLEYLAGYRGPGGTLAFFELEAAI